MDVDPSNVPTRQKKIEWKRCFRPICQRRTSNEKSLKCPALMKSADSVKEIYKKFLDHANYPSLTNVSDHKIDWHCLDDGSGVLNSLIKNKGKWHQACRLQFYPSIVERTISKSVSDGNEACMDEGENVEEETRRSSRQASTSIGNVIERNKSECMFCQKGEDIGELFSIRGDNTHKK